MKREQLSYMMLFCSMLLVREGKATLEQTLRLVPLGGGARDLAGRLLDGPR